MQVYRIEGPGLTEPEYFRNFSDIEASLKISYSTCEDVNIDKAPTIGPVKFTVTGKRRAGAPFSDVFLVTRFPVWDSATHL